MSFNISAGAPKVQVEERDFTNFVPGVSTSIGALVCSLNWGPVLQVMTVGSEPDLVNKVWKPTDACYEGFLQASQYLLYSNHLKLVRAEQSNMTNAIAGGNGTGLTLNVVALNGEIQSFTINSGSKGTNYIAGDIVTINGGTTTAKIRVTSVDNNGGVLTAVLLNNGTGYASNATTSTTVLSSITVKNDVDFEDSEYLPDVIARYPGDLGNHLMFSSVRASDFDLWRFKERFVRPPTADIVRYDGVAGKKVFALPTNMQTLPSDAVVTVNGISVTSGVNPGQYSVSGGNLTFTTQVETFTANNATSKYTLTNTNAVNTEGYVAKVAGVEYPRYSGVGEVPYGYVRVISNSVEFGLKRAKFNGDAVTKVFTIVGVTDSSDAKVKLDGTYKTVVTTGTPATGQVKVEVVSGNTIVTFAAVDSAPGIGNKNIEIEWGFIDSGSITIEYGFPPVGLEKVKIFTNQNAIHIAIADFDGKIIDGEKYAIIERYSDLSLIDGTKFYDGTSSYYKDVINRNSNFVRISNLTNHNEKVFSHGSNGDTVTDSQLIEGYKIFKDVEAYNIAHVIGGGASKELVSAIISEVSEYRKDCVAYFVPPKSVEVSNRGNEFDAIMAHKRDLPSTSYGHFGNGWKYVLDTYNGKARWIPCAADHAGLYAQMHTNDVPWKSGAGFNYGRIKNTIKLAWSPNPTQMDAMYAENINPSKNFMNEGPVLYGDKTMQTKDSAFQGMNIRWLFIVLEKAISKAAKYFLFENNTQFTRDRYVSMVTPYLRDVKGGDGIEAFKVVCDETNNTGEVRRRKEFKADHQIKPVYSINFITLRFTAVGPDVSFEEITN